MRALKCQQAGREREREREGESKSRAERSHKLCQDLDTCPSSAAAAALLVLSYVKYMYFVCLLTVNSYFSC